MRTVRITTDLLRVDGGLFRAGTVLTVLREYRATGYRERDAVMLALGYEDGRVVLPCVEVGSVEVVE